MWTIVAAVLIAVALYVVENYGGNGFVPSWDQIYQWVGLEPSQSETTAPLPEGKPKWCSWMWGRGCRADFAERCGLPD